MLQETLSKFRTKVICGTGSVRYFKLEAFAMCFSRLKMDRLEAWSLDAIRGIDQLRNSGNIQLFSRKGGYESPEAQVVDILERTRERSCTDQRDRLFALGGVFDDPELLPYAADYIKDVAAVYSDFAIRVLERSQTLIILTHSGLAKIRKYDMASWIPDWSSVYLPFLSRRGLYIDIPLYRADARNSALRRGFTVKAGRKYTALNVSAYVFDEI